MNYIKNKFKITKKELFDGLIQFGIFLLFIAAVVTLQYASTIVVGLSEIDLYSLCNLSGTAWMVRNLVMGVTLLSYDPVFNFLRKICQKVKKGAKIVRISLTIIFITFMAMLFATRLVVLTGLLTTSLYGIHLCQLHTLLYNKSHWMIKGTLNYGIIILTMVPSYLCMANSDVVSRTLELVLTLCGYLLTVGIMIFLSIKTKLLNPINLTNQTIDQNEVDENHEPLVEDENKDPEMEKAEKQNKSTMKVYALLFISFSVYLTTNQPSISYAYLNGNFAVATQAIVYVFTLVLVYFAKQVITLEDTTNFLISILCGFFGLDVIYKSAFQTAVFSLELNFQQMAGSMTFVVNMILAHIQKDFYNIYSLDQHVRISQGFFFLSFVFQNYQYKRTGDFTALAFENTNYTFQQYDTYDYYQLYFPIIQACFSLTSIPISYLGYWYYKRSIQNFKEEQIEEQKSKMKEQNSIFKNLSIQ